MESVPHLSEAQVAERWGLSPKTLQRWRTLRASPDYLRIGKYVRYRLCDVERFEETVLTKCDGTRRSGKPRMQEDQLQPITPCYPTIKDALQALYSDKVARS